jgi:uncharacterized ParB-like nuclease family protein
MQTIELRLDEVKVDLNWQTRVGLDEDHLASIQKTMAGMPTFFDVYPVLVYRDENLYVQLDGFHRNRAARNLGRKTLKAQVFEGDPLEAKAAAVTANLRGALKLMREDKIKAAKMLWTNPGTAANTGRKGGKVTGSSSWVADVLGEEKGTVCHWLDPNNKASNRKHNTEVRRKVNRYNELGEEALKESFKEQFGLDVFNQPFAPIVPWSMNDNIPGAPGSPMLFISDIHYGETVDPAQVFYTNEYNCEIAKRRLEHTFEMAVTLLKQHLAHPEYPGITLVLGGDMISGSLHEDIAVSDEIRPIDQAFEVAGLIAEGVEFLAREFPMVSVYGVPGNHGRVTRKPWAKFYAQQNLDWAAYKAVRLGCAKLDNVAFNFPASRDVTFTVANRSFRLTHGDQFRGGDGVIGAIGPIVRGDMKKRVTASLMPGQPEQYDTLLCGHFHQSVMMPRVIVNGSVKGYDEFALGINVPWEPPQQALWVVHPRHGIVWYMPVMCDEDYSAHAIEKAA